MKQESASPDLRQSLLISLVVLIMYALLVFLMMRAVQAIPPRVDTERTTRSLEMFAVVLGLLAGGCMAGYFTFDYSRIKFRERKGALLVSWLYIGSIFLLTFLILYTLRKSGAFQPMDNWAAMLLFIATYAFLNGLILYERWKMNHFIQD